MLTQFLSDISIDGCMVQVGTENTVIDSFPGNLDEAALKKLVEKNTGKNLYFLGGIKKATHLQYKRATDDDIDLKNYFYLDFDIRKAHQEVTDEEIRRDAFDMIRGALTTSDSQLANWRYIVFTGNGLHVYYFGSPVKITDKAAWRMGVKTLLEEASAILGEAADTACINPARIARLPGSLNNKSEPAKLVEILEYDKNAIFDLSSLEDIGKKKIKGMEDENKKIATELAKDFPDTDDCFKAINELPIAAVVTKVTGWESRGTHFRAPGAQKDKACFVSGNGNFLVPGGSEHIPDTKGGYRPFDFVKTMKKLDNLQTFMWFRENFPVINEKFPTKTQTVVNSSEIKQIFHELRHLSYRQLSLTPELDKWRLVVRGNVTRIGAMSYMGKSRAGYYLIHLLLRHGYRGAIFSTEVQRPEVLAHLLAIQMKADPMDIKEHRIAVPDGLEEDYKNLAIYDVRQTQNNLLRIDNIIMELNKTGEKPLDFVLVDFAQSVSPKGGSSREIYDTMRRYALESQEIAQRHNVAYICISQLSKEGIRDENEKFGHIPFEGGGSLYQSADIAVMIKRDRAEHVVNNIVTWDVRKSKPLGRRVNLTLEYSKTDSSFKYIGSSEDINNI